MSTFRVHKTVGYAVISNTVFEDQELSFRALGVLCYLLSKPDNWLVRSSELQRSHSEGRDAVRSALQELLMAGYITKSRARGEGGKIVGIDYEVHEVPQATDWKPAQNTGQNVRKPGDGFPGAGGEANGAVSTGDWETAQNGHTDIRKPGDGKPGDGFPGSLPSTDLPSTERERESREERHKEKEDRTADTVPSLDAFMANEAFEMVWAAFGRKGNKVAAKKRYDQDARKVPVATVLEGVARYLAYLAAADRPKQDAERWIHERGWESEWDIAGDTVHVNGVAKAPLLQRGVMPGKTEQLYAANAATVGEWIQSRKEGANGGVGGVLGPGAGAAGGPVRAPEWFPNGSAAGPIPSGVIGHQRSNVPRRLGSSGAAGNDLPRPGDDPEVRGAGEGKDR